MKLSGHRNTVLLCAIGVLMPLLGLAAEMLTFSIVPNYFTGQPDNQPLGPCHGGIVADRAGNIYVSTDTARGIVVYSGDGKYLRTFGPTRIHAMDIRREDGQEYLYVARPSDHEVVKLKLDGTEVWKITYPTEANIYTKADEFRPTAVAVARDGTVFVADGYGKNYIHRYDSTPKYVKSFGGPGMEEGKLHTCHGISVDNRGATPMLFVCNRESGRVEHWDFDGKFVKVLQRDLRMPAAAHIRGDYAAIAELKGRVTVLDRNNEVASRIGDNPDQTQWANFPLAPEQWKEGICNSPHSVVILRDGNLVVSEWSKFGRVNRYVRMR